ncbi:hypothetical protein BGW41_004783 [Actinomortierella wolfii]|nr:hypothetical protein BGW41_004783 [Actinomortierella wolfii]
MVTADHITWVLNKESSKEHVSFRSFVLQFGYTHQKTAHEAYQLLLNSPRIHQRRRDRLIESYRAFQQRSDESFWAEICGRRSETDAGVGSSVDAGPSHTHTDPSVGQKRPRELYEDPNQDLQETQGSTPRSSTMHDATVITDDDQFVETMGK